MSKKQVTVTLIKSKFGRKPGHRECVEGLGLRRLHQSIRVDDNQYNRGMIQKVHYLLKVEEG